jgi:hypothetical protein
MSRVQVPATWEFLEELFEAVPDLSVLVFAHHKAVLDALQELLQKKERVSFASCHQVCQ